MVLEPKWTENDDLLLKQYYALETKEFICSLFPNRTWNGIKQHAYGKLKLKKETTARTKNGNVSKLLEETPEAYYWMGFLLADGSFDKHGRLTLSVGIQDKEHIEKFASFLETDKISFSSRKTNFSECSSTYKISCFSAYYGPKIREKFDLQLNKTKNPPNLSAIFNNTTRDNSLALIIGYIDGDGSITSMNKGKSTNIKIQAHKAWLVNLETIEKYIYDSFLETSPKTSKIDVRGYAKLGITRNSIIKKLKTLTLALPSMERKWTKIAS